MQKDKNNNYKTDPVLSFLALETMESQPVQMLLESLAPLFKSLEELVLLISMQTGQAPAEIADSLEALPALFNDWVRINFEKFQDAKEYLVDRYTKESRSVLLEKLKVQSESLGLHYMLLLVAAQTFQDEFIRTLLSIFGIDENDEQYLQSFRQASLDLRQICAFLEVIEQWTYACEIVMEDTAKGIELLQKLYQRLEREPFFPAQGILDPFRIRILFEISRFMEENGQQKEISRRYLKLARDLIHLNQFEGLEGYKAHIEAFYDISLLEKRMDEGILNRIVRGLETSFKAFENYPSEENYLLVLDLSMQFFGWTDTLKEEQKVFLEPWFKRIYNVLIHLFERMDFSGIELENLEPNAFAALYLARNLKMALPKEKISPLFEHSVDLYTKAFEQEGIEDLSGYLEALLESFGVYAHEHSKRKQAGRALDVEAYPVLDELFQKIQKLITTYPQLAQDPEISEEINSIYQIMDMLG